MVSGSGTSGDPYILSTFAELELIGSDATYTLSKYYKLGADIDASPTQDPGYNAGAGWLPRGNATTKFTGGFDGNNYTISGLYINRSTTNYVGLFGFINTSNIKNVTLTTSNIIGQDYVGSVIGGTIDINNADNCNVSGTVTGRSYVGGIIGYSYHGGDPKHFHTNHDFTGTVTSTTSYVGGIIGYGRCTSISGCNVNATINGASYVGGIAGYNGWNGPTIQTSTAIGTINATGNYVGGVVGQVGHTITVTGITISDTLTINSSNSTYVGGIIGGASDNWGMTADEILRPTSLALVMEWLNIASTAHAVEIRNIRLALYTQYDETLGNLGFTLNGEHSRDYNIFIVPGFDKPEGAKTKFNSLELTGRDGNLITGSRIEDKEIKLKFYVVGSTLEECQERLTEATLWMTSTRNRLKIPTPKTMVFDWDTTREYRVVLDDVVDVDFKDGLFECQAKFNVPDGVAFSPLKVTGAVESNNGLTHVYPVITVITDGQSSNVAIFEHRSNQIFILNHQFTAGTVLIIDCKNRTVKDTDGTDYTTEVALVSVWPMLSGPYDFTRSTGCVIQTVAFQEGK